MSLIEVSGWVHRSIRGPILFLFVTALTGFGAVAQENLYSTIEANVRALSDPSAAVREVAAEALGRIGAPAVPALEEALKTSDTDVQEAVVRALAYIGLPAVPALGEALKSPDTDVQVAAASALSALVMMEPKAPGGPVTR